MKKKVITYLDLLILFVLGIIVGLMLSVGCYHLSDGNDKGKMIPDTIKVESLLSSNQMARK